MKHRGSQIRETVEAAGFRVIRVDHHQAVLENEDGEQEVWQENDRYAGYVVEINGVGYEFVRTL